MIIDRITQSHYVLRHYPILSNHYHSISRGVTGYLVKTVDDVKINRSDRVFAYTSCPGVEYRRYGDL